MAWWLGAGCPSSRVGGRVFNMTRAERRIEEPSQKTFSKHWTLCVNFMPFWEEADFFSIPYLFKSEWVSVGGSEVMSGREGPAVEIWWQTLSVGWKETHVKHLKRKPHRKKSTRLLSSTRRLRETRRLSAVFNVKKYTKPTRRGLKHRKSPPPPWETITTLLTEQTFLEFSRILLAVKIQVQW